MSVADLERLEKDLKAAVAAGGVTQGALTDRSGTITTGGTRQQIAAANTSRRYLLVQNPTGNTDTLWLAFGTNATAASPSIELLPGMTLIWDGTFVPTDRVDIVGATTSTPFTAKEG